MCDGADMYVCMYVLCGGCDCLAVAAQDVSACMAWCGVGAMCVCVCVGSVCGMYVCGGGVLAVCGV